MHRFLHSSAYARAEVLDTLSALNRVGRVVIFGGAIRDLALYGNTEFPSDIDVVLECADAHTLAAQMESLKAYRNRFGGFRFSTIKWKFDVWRLEDTWALKQGHVAGHSARALLQSTFFDWDAIAYDFTNREFHFLDGYFERLQEGVVDINLEPNPNPLGNARRALDIYWTGRAGIAPRLAQFVATTVSASEGFETGEHAQGRIAALRDFLQDVATSGGRPVKRRVEQLPLMGLFGRHPA